MKHILFQDGVCPSQYTLNTLNVKSLGGTEASCLRIVEGLAKRGHHIVISQRNRINTHTDLVDTGSLTYCPLETNFANNNFDTVITLRDAGHYRANVLKFPKAKHYLWMHDVVGGDYGAHMEHHLGGFNNDLICVSDWHKDQIHRQLPGVALNIKRIYGPLAPYCTKTTTQFDPYKLIFFSSPHKGLEGTLAAFVRLRAREPRFRLFLSNPGYFKDAVGLPEGVINLGSLPHHSLLMDHVRESLCTFYPNTVFEETFGLVMAESDAVGTPVIAHRIGAAPEVISHPKEIMDCRDVDKVVERVLAWSKGERPIVKGRIEFTLNTVLNEWEKVI